MAAPLRRSTARGMLVADMPGRPRLPSPFFVLIAATVAAVALAAPQDASLPDAALPSRDAGPDAAGEQVDASAPDADVMPAADAGMTLADAGDGAVGSTDGDSPADAEVIDELAEDEEDLEENWLGPTEELPPEEAWVFIDKSERRMVAQDGRGWQETFRVALGFEPRGDKALEGDGRTPEGEFYVCNRVRHNRFHRFLGLSYPTPEDAHRGEVLGLLMPIEIRAILRAHRRREMPPWRTALGGNVGIHGYGRRTREAARHAAGEDWTDGCVAVTNDEVERIYDHIRLGTRVVIVP